MVHVEYQVYITPLRLHKDAASETVHKVLHSSLLGQWMTQRIAQPSLIITSGNVRHYKTACSDLYHYWWRSRRGSVRYKLDSIRL